jgi:hypothetical protein
MDVQAHDVGLEGLDALQGVEALCLFVGEDQRPLEGLAGFVDWRLCGGLSRLLRQGFFTGKKDDKLLLPAEGRLSMERVFVVGVGRAHALDPVHLGDALLAAGEMLHKAKIQSVALPIPEGDHLEEATRAAAFTAKFLPAFKGSRVEVMVDKGLGRLVGGR